MYSFNKYLLGTSYVPSAFVGTWDEPMNKMKIPVLWRWGQGRTIDYRCNREMHFTSM